MKKTIIKFSLTLVCLLLVSNFNFALASNEKAPDLSDLNVFKSIYDVTPIELKFPTAVKVFLSNPQNFGVAVIAKSSGEAQPVEIIKMKTDYPKVTVKETSAVRGEKANFADQDQTSIAEFDIDADLGKAFINLEFSKPLTSSNLYLELNNYVALPSDISIEANVDGEWITALATQDVNSTSINFPQRTAKLWRINFSHVQPLSLREITLSDDKASTEAEKTGEEIVWLAQPGESYKLYVDAATYVAIKTGESGNLLQNPSEIKEVSLSAKYENPIFKEPDGDNDGVPNYRDNCVNLSNPDQTDLDNNKRGDACEDHDKDGVMDSIDNCSSEPNSAQLDTDGDKIGDACDKEESRTTEKLPWLPWASMGVAALVIIGIIIQSLRKDKKA